MSRVSQDYAPAPRQKPLAAAARPQPVRQPPPLPDRPSRWKIGARKVRRGLRPPLLASAVILLALGWLIAANLFNGEVWRTRLGQATAGLGFRIAHIDLVGNAKTPPSAILDQLKAREGTPTLAVAVDAARRGIESLPWIRSARVERILPDTIRITIVERSPIALWQSQGNFVLIDRAGKIVTDSDVKSFADKLPLVVGPGAPEAALALLDQLATQPDLQSRLVAAIRIGGRRWNLCLNSGAEVLLPEGAEAPALIRLAELQSSNKLLERPLREIDLRLPDQLRVRPLTDGGCTRSGVAPAQATSPNASPLSRKAT